LLLLLSLVKLFVKGDAGAIEMNWMDVDGDKLCEPVVNYVSLFDNLFLFVTNIRFGIGGGLT